MTELYKRVVRLSVFTGSQATDIEYDKDGNGLDVEFDIEAFASQNRKTAPNKATITVYNLAAKHRQIFAEEHQAIELYAGYGDDIGLIFVGQTTNVINTKEPTRWVTTIYAGDGIKDWSTRYFSKTYPAGTLVSAILTDMAAATGLPYTIDTLDVNTILLSETYVGRVKDVLTSFCNQRGLEWSIQWGVVEVTQKDSPLRKDPTAEVIRSDTGMIGSPSLIEQTTDEKKESTKQKRKFGVRVTTLLNHKIKPTRVIEIKSAYRNTTAGKLDTEKLPEKDINGTYVAKIVRHYGSTHGSEFYTEIEADLNE